MPSHLITLRQLLDKAKGKMLIPAYQRRYMWGRNRTGECDAATLLTLCINRAHREKETYFMQGLTLARDNDETIVVDGQQRLTFFSLLLTCLNSKSGLDILYHAREKAEEWLKLFRSGSISNFDPLDSDSQDVYFFKRTIGIIKHNLDAAITPEWVLDNIYFLCIELSCTSLAIPAYKMMNGTKQPMLITDIIKADLMRMASDNADQDDWETNAMRNRISSEWEYWTKWWNNPDVKDCFDRFGAFPLDLMIRLILREPSDDFKAPITYAEFRKHIKNTGQTISASAKNFFHALRRAQRRIMQVWDEPESYNKMRAILLLQNYDNAILLLRSCLISASINKDTLDKIYKLSFLGMSVEAILRDESPLAKFDDMLASISQADVYHTEAKRDAFALLLRLNIDEDNKLGRKFDFSIWHNRSLEHIYSKSKVWHPGPGGEPLDGNDNRIRMPLYKIERDKSFIRREQITNYDGTPLSEHCIGNLVLLYGINNASFGNANFEEKKEMFLSPADIGPFQSRNLLHSVFVFARREWGPKSIVDNYNLILKNLKLYYGFK